MKPAVVGARPSSFDNGFTRVHARTKRRYLVKRKSRRLPLLQGGRLRFRCLCAPLRMGRDALSGYTPVRSNHNGVRKHRWCVSTKIQRQAYPHRPTFVIINRFSPTDTLAHIPNTHAHIHTHTPYKHADLFSSVWRQPPERLGD